MGYGFYDVFLVYFHDNNRDITTLCNENKCKALLCIYLTLIQNPAPYCSSEPFCVGNLINNLPINIPFFFTSLISLHPQTKILISQSNINMKLCFIAQNVIILKEYQLNTCTTLSIIFNTSKNKEERVYMLQEGHFFSS